MSASQPLLVGVDVGTTRVKAGLIGLDGGELARAAVPTVWHPQPTGAEASPAEFAQAVRDVLATLLADAPAGEILAVGITSMAETAILVGPDGQAVGPAIAWYDRRAEADVEQMEMAFPRAEIDRQTGLGIGPIPTVVMLRWLMRVHSDLRRAVKALSVAEWIVHSLGGSIGAEPSLASRTGALAIGPRGWWREVIEWAGLPDGLFPELVPAGASWGHVRAGGGPLERLDGAALTVAGHDHLVAAIGSGVTGASQVMDSCGTAEALVRAVPADGARDPAAGLSQGIATGWHALEGCHCLLAGLPLGIELTPLLARLGGSHQGGLASADAEALALLDGGLAGQDASAPARDWLSALQRCVARAARALRGLEDLGGPVAEVRISGGWAANPVLRRLKTNAFPNTVYPAVGEAGARGAALLAGQAAGVFASAESFPPPPLADESDADETRRRPRPLSLSNHANEGLLP